MTSKSDCNDFIIALSHTTHYTNLLKILRSGYLKPTVVLHKANNSYKRGDQDTVNYKNIDVTPDE